MKHYLSFSLLTLSLLLLLWANRSFWWDVNIIELFTNTVTAANDAINKNDINTGISYLNQAKEICEKFPEYKDKIWKSCGIIDELLDKYSTSTSDSDCKTWYIRNETETECVKDTFEQRSLNCKTWYWENTEMTNYSDCNCKTWYIRNEDQTKCVEYTVEQMQKSCKARYWENVHASWYNNCECNKWYVFDKDETTCLIDLSQKSLSTKIMNTINAKCDNSDTISSCEKDPTWNKCPWVCLELYDAINWMYDNQLTIYNDPTKFWIYDEITREQASKFFVNFHKVIFNKTSMPIPIKNPFTDIYNANPTLYNYILASFSLNLFKGNNWKFMPFNHLTKAQALAVIIRMAFWLLDETNNPWYSNYLYKAESLNLLDNINYSQSSLDNEDILRWDVALMLYRLYVYLME